MKKLKKVLYETLLLILPVMLGVYLGLLANTWHDEKEEKELIEKALVNLSQEIEHNYTITQESLSYFRQLRDTIYKLDGRNTLPSSFGFWKGLNPPLLKDASFQSASLSGVLSQFNLDLLRQLTSAYELQSDIQLQSNNYIQSVTNRIGEESFTNDKYLIILENYAHDQISSEEELITELKNLHQLISKSLKSQ